MSYVTLFLYRVGMSKLFCSFGVGFNSAFWHSLFREGYDKDDWLTFCSSYRSQLLLCKILQYSQQNIRAVSLFNEVVGLDACNFIKEWLRHRCLPVNIAKYYKKQLFLRKLTVAAYISTRKGKEEESAEQKKEKIFKCKKQKWKHFI